MTRGRTLLLSTVHGSHLYGTAHAGSDRDTYTVWTPIRGPRAAWADQTIAGDDDVFSVDLPTWLTMLAKGVPQALEALFSTVADHDLIGGLRASWRPGTAVYPTYLRTMRHFIATDDVKRRRHAVRLALNLADLHATGRFDPTMTPAQVETMRTLEETVPGVGLVGVCEAVAFGAWPVPAPEPAAVDSTCSA